MASLHTGDRSLPGGTTICLIMPLGGLPRHSSEEQHKNHA